MLLEHLAHSHLPSPSPKKGRQLCIFYYYFTSLEWESRQTHFLLWNSLIKTDSLFWTSSLWNRRSSRSWCRSWLGFSSCLTDVFIIWIYTPSPQAHERIYRASFQKYLFFTYLAMLGLSCGMWDLVPWPGIEPESPALGAWSLSHRTTREVPIKQFWMVWNRGT